MKLFLKQRFIKWNNKILAWIILPVLFHMSKLYFAMMFFYNESPIKGIKKNYQSKLNPLQKFKKKPNKPKTKQNANFFKTS